MWTLTHSIASAPRACLDASQPHRARRSAPRRSRPSVHLSRGSRQGEQEQKRQPGPAGQEVRLRRCPGRAGIVLIP